MTSASSEPGLWSPERRQLTLGLVLTITLVAFEALAIATVMPQVKDDLGGLALYGWVFSGFFLASILGIVVSGQLADRRGLALPFTAGLMFFAMGLVIGGLAQSMPVLVAGRVLQGFGAGAIPAVGYAAIGRGYPASLRPRMFATTSTAWVVPGLIGPAIATLVEHAWSWRVVFLGLLPIVALAGVMTIPAMRALGAEPTNPSGDLAAADRRRLGRVVLLVLGVGGVLVALSDAPPALGIALVVVGLPLAAWSFVGLVPAGTARLRRGVPATVAVRGILTCGFFSADAYVSLAIIDGRGASTWLVGAALTAGTITWAAGSWIQARLIGQLGPRRLVAIGLSLMVVAVGLLLAMALGLPAWTAVVAWGFGGTGMGLAYTPLSIVVLAAAKAGEEGVASASLQLSDTLGVAVGTGIGGAIIALGDSRGWAVSSSTAVVFASSLGVTMLALLATRRLPSVVPTNYG